MKSMGSLAIRIDGGRFVRMDGPVGLRQVRLQTLQSGQKSAVLEFFRFGRRGPVAIRSVRIDSLASDDRPAQLPLRVERISRVRWVVQIRRPDGRTLDVRLRTGTGLWPLIPAGLLFAAAVVLVIALLTPFRSADGVHSPAIRAVNGTQAVQVPSPGGQVESVEGGSDGMVSPAADTTGEPLPSPGNTVVDVPEVRDSPASDQTAGSFLNPVVIYFEPESALLSDAAERILDGLAVPGDSRLVITGHCAQYGTERGRRALSTARAVAVAEYLKDRGSGYAGIETIGLGADRPADRTLEGQNRNRRVEIEIMPD